MRTSHFDSIISRLYIMLHSIWTRLIDWWRRPADGGYVDSNAGLGILDVSVYAEPSGSDDFIFLRRVEELKALQEKGKPPHRTLIDYFADRYLERSISRYVGCPFERYLSHPLLVEQIRDDIAEGRASRTTQDARV